MKLTDGLKAAMLVTIVVLVSMSTCALGDEGTSPGQSYYRIDSAPKPSMQVDDLYSQVVLLMNRSHQLESLGACDVTDQDSRERCTEFLDDYESQLRHQAELLDSFEDLLINEWPNLSEEQRISLTASLEDLLRREAILLNEFQSCLKKFYCLLPPSSKKKFLNSYEDLLKREANLLLGFEDILHLQQTIRHSSMIAFLESFEDLIRRQAMLLDSFEDFLKVNCNILKIHKSVDKCGFRPGQKATYNYVISNTDNFTIVDIKIVDDHLGKVIEGITLGPYETKTFSKSTILDEDVPGGTKICNRARVFGVDPKGFTVSSLSNMVCIRLICEAVNYDSVNLGDQRSLALSSDLAKADNFIEIEKDQKTNCAKNVDSRNAEKIKVGNQFAAAFQSGRAKNSIKIIEGQRPD